MMLGIVGVSFLILCYAVVSGVQSCPIWVLIIGAFCITFSGGHPQLQSNVLCYISDTVGDKGSLTIRMSIVGACWSMGYVVGGYIAGQLTVYLSLEEVMICGLGVVFISYLYVLIFTDQVPPVVMAEILESRKKLDEEALYRDSLSVETADSGDNAADPPDKLVRYSGDDTATVAFVDLMKDIYKTLSRKRPGRQRTYIYLTCLAFFSYVTVDQGLDVVYLYMYRLPRTFTPKLAGYWTSANSLIQMVGTLVGAFVFKWLKWSDVSIILISMASAVAKVAVLSIAEDNLTIFLAPIAGCLSVLGNAGVEAFLAQLVDVDEVGKIYSVIGICAMMSPIVSTVVYFNIYAATLVWWDGFVFVFVAILVTMSFILMLYIYLDMKYCNPGASGDEEYLTDSIEDSPHNSASTLRS